MSIHSDEQQIRDLAATWMTATKTGDTATVLGLMSDGAVFLLPGRPPMRKPEFAQAMQAQSGASAPQVDGSSEIQEIKVLGDWAFMWTKLKVVVTPRGGNAATRAGYTLTILKKENGRWVLARDANLLAPVNPATS